MGKRRKGRSVRKNQQTHSEPEEVVQAPHSFIIHRGLPGGHIVELTKDFRKVMEPFTASTLKERKRNTIKDFVSVSGVLHVSHMCIFTRTELGMYLKIAKLPRGPTLTFKLHSFALARDVVSSLKKQLVIDEAFKHSPLIIMNSFSGEGMQMKLMASTFQNMFPTINLTTVDLNTIRRCVLLNYNPVSKLIDFRHYAVKVCPVGISKGVKKVVQGKVPDLSRCNDISEFLTKSTVLSESEFEDDPSNHVTLAQKIASRGNMENSQSAIRLSELGPRLTLQLIKVEDGLLDGEVLYHELVHKSEEEIAAIQKKREAKRKLKEKRKKIQELNTKKKIDIKEELKQKSLEGMQKQKGKTESDRLMRQAVRESNAETNMEDDDDAEYYREEVGEEPDQDLFSKRPQKRSLPPNEFTNKKPRFDSNKNQSGENKFVKKKFEGGDQKFDKKKKFDGNFNKGGSKPSTSKWPGGRGANPRYGFNPQTEDDNQSSFSGKKDGKFPDKKSFSGKKDGKFGDKKSFSGKKDGKFGDKKSFSGKRDGKFGDKKSFSGNKRASFSGKSGKFGDKKAFSGKRPGKVHGSKINKMRNKRR